MDPTVSRCRISNPTAPGRSVTVSLLFSDQATLNLWRLNVGTVSETVARIDPPYITRYPVKTDQWWFKAYHSLPAQSLTLTQHWASTGSMLYVYRNSKKPYLEIWAINPLTAKLFNLNFHSLEVVPRWRDPQLKVSENYSDLTKWRLTVFKYCWLMSHFIFNLFKRWYIMC